MKTIQSADNAAVKHLARLLQQRRYRTQTRQIVLEGIHLLDAFLNAGHVPVAVYIPQHRLAHNEVAALLHRLPEHLVTVVADAALGKITSLTHADDIMTLMDLPAVAALPQSGDCVVLDRVQDPGNVGTILRSALAAGVGQVILSADCADVFSPKVLRAAMGAHAVLNLYPDTDLAVWRQQYRDSVYATALANAAANLYDLDLRPPAAWVFGNEGAGVSAQMIQAATHNVVIPMSGPAESLNVAMAATVCLFEQQRQRLAAKP